ncbi:hypothetical protein XGA_4243 [Xanthomonas hortorum ATCC 19865]|nr:hypothetical protein XGA_4243 [Xanthomonas hortorum ATCC 19865]
MWTAARHSKTAQPMAIGARWWSIARSQDLTRGIAVDAPLDASQQGPRPRVRQPIMLTQTARKTEAGRYMLELYAKRRPTRAFWVEAVSSERKVVLAGRPGTCGRGPGNPRLAGLHRALVKETPVADRS